MPEKLEERIIECVWVFELHSVGSSGDFGLATRWHTGMQLIENRTKEVRAFRAFHQEHGRLDLARIATTEGRKPLVRRHPELSAQLAGVQKHVFSEGCACENAPVKPKGFRRVSKQGFWKIAVLPAARRVDSLLDRTRSQSHRLNLAKMFSRSDDVVSAQVALDTAEDTMLALLFFARRGIGRTDGEKYLRLYGFLQAIHLQQDASLDKLHCLFVSRSAQHATDSGWTRLRHLRNLTVGHPLEHGSKRKGLGLKRASITRVSLETHGFDYQVWYRELQKFGFENVELDFLFSQYLDEAADTLDAVLPVLVSGPDYRPDA